MSSKTFKYSHIYKNEIFIVLNYIDVVDVMVR